MERVSLVGLWLVAALATAGVVCASAVAEAPEFGKCVAKAGGKYKNSACTETEAGNEKYEWAPVGSPVSFTSKMPSGDKLTFESADKDKYVCSGEELVGEIANAHELRNVVMVWTGCEFAGLKCGSYGQAEGEIMTVDMDGGIGYEKQGTKGNLNAKLVQEWKPESGELFVTFQCVGTEFKLRGSVLHSIVDNKMASSETEKFTQSKGINKPNHYLGEPEDSHVLEAKSGSVGEYEDYGWTLTTETKFEESIEANTVV